MNRSDGSPRLVSGDDYPFLSRAKVGLTHRLLERKYRQQHGQILIEGPQSVREAIASDWHVCHILVHQPEHHREILASCDEQGIDVFRLDAQAAKHLSTTVNTAGLWAVVESKEYSLDDIGSCPQLVVICAQIRDPGNAGTVIRCADAFGADGLIFTHASVELANPKTVRASTGSIFHLPIVTDVHYAQAVDWVHSYGGQVLAADTSGIGLPQAAREGIFASPVAWVMGNEAWAGTPLKLF